MRHMHPTHSAGAAGLAPLGEPVSGLNLALPGTMHRLESLCHGLVFDLGRVLIALPGLDNLGGLG